MFSTDGTRYELLKKNSFLASGAFPAALASFGALYTAFYLFVPFYFYVLLVSFFVLVRTFPSRSVSSFDVLRVSFSRMSYLIVLSVF